MVRQPRRKSSLKGSTVMFQRIHLLSLIVLLVAALVGCSSSSKGAQPSQSASTQVTRTEPSGALKSYQQTISSAVKALTLKPGETVTVNVTVTNPGPETWQNGGTNPVDLSYHWLRNDEVLPSDGDRAYLERPLEPGQSVTLKLPVVAPRTSGQLTLGISMVQEGLTWFALGPGGSWYRIPVRVQ